MKYLADEVGEAYKSWGLNDMVFLFSGTGSGKTKFSLGEVSLYHLKQGHNVLYLVPRKILMRQIEEDIDKLLSCNPADAPRYNKNIKVWTYQYLENCLLSGLDIEQFDVIICDEFHYFIVDSIFNNNTENSFNYVIHSFKSLRLFLSATSMEIMDYMEKYGLFPVFKKNPQKGELSVGFSRGNRKTHTYELSKNYDYVDVKYLSDDNEILDIVNKTNGKTIIFISNKDNGLRIKEDLENNSIDCIFITAENKENDSKEDVDEIVNNNTFSKKVLITTSVLDVGVNILDTDVENMVIAANEPVEFLQMLGRFRVIQEGQAISLYIYARNKKYFQNLCYRQIKPKIECCKYLEQCSNLEEVFKNSLTHENNLPEGYDKFLYINYKDNTVALNKAAAYRYRQLYHLYSEILDGMVTDEDYFIKKQLKWLGLEDTFRLNNYYSIEIQKDRIDKLREIIECEAKKNENGMLKEGISDIKTKFFPFIRKIDPNSIRTNQTLSNKKFNCICKIYDIPYRIAQRQETIDKKILMKYYLLNVNDDKINTLKLNIAY